MYVCTRRDKLVDLMKFNSVLEPAGERIQASYDARAVAARRADREAEIACRISLDDLGGRSDALGG